MLSIPQGFHELFGRCGLVGAIATALRPQLYDIPIVSKIGIAFSFLNQGVLQLRYAKQACKIMSLAKSAFFLSGKSCRRVAFAMHALRAHSTQ